MRKFLLFLLIFGLIYLNGFSQTSKYIVQFTDKTGTPFSINNPTQFLSQRSVDRRVKQKIAIDETDLPLTPRYLDSIRLSGNVTILNISKWLNQVCIQTDDPAALNKINTFSFVKVTKQVRRPLPDIQPVQKFKETFTASAPAAPQNFSGYYDYGFSLPQIHFHNGEYLHNKGFHGEGMLAAIMDAGFYGYLTNPFFDSVRNAGRIKETFDFVNNEVSVNEDYLHGMQCFSLLAANKPGVLVGTAPAANYYLYRTEDFFTEYPIEEQNWVAAAERADSIGVDVFSTSLGYNTFDNPAYNHTYADLNGKTTIIARANALAGKKGIISIVSAGNEGNGSWHYITTPADADSILSVGAANSSGVMANFSSYGPASDNRIKPDVASVGSGTAVSNASGSVIYGSGTSFAAPNLAGLVICLWQAFPEFTNMEIMDAVKKSCPTYNTPDIRKGYGFPDFEKAFQILTDIRTIRNASALGNDWIKAFPNPFSKTFNVLLKVTTAENAVLSLYDAAGKLVAKQQITTTANQVQTIKFDNLVLQRGIYTLRYSDNKNKRSIKLLAK